MQIRPIGGYFEWEFPQKKSFDLFDNSILLNSGRHSLEYLLTYLSPITTLYIPHFTCDVILKPLARLGIVFKYYNITADLHLLDMPVLGSGEYLLFTNYFGVCDDYIKMLSDVYGHQLIVDNAQALFCEPFPNSHHFYSPRKFLGMPDGGIVVSSIDDHSKELPVDLSYDRCSHLLKRHELEPIEGYNDFKANSKKISESPVRRMSHLSQSILESVDLEYIKERRNENFDLLNSVLSTSNLLNIPSRRSFSCPLVYPYMTDREDLRMKLIDNSIFVATYWPNVLETMTPCSIEYRLAKYIIALPIDQRYGRSEMNRILSVIQDQVK